MKLSRIAYGFLACGLVVGSLELTGASLANGGGSNLSAICGSYSSVFSGYELGNPLQPFAGTGLFIGDGDGNLRGHETTNFNGSACNYEVKGTYTVVADGTGTDAISFINGSQQCPSGSYTQSLVVANGGDTVLLSNTNSSDVATERWYRTDKTVVTGCGLASLRPD